jgi:hypothetical protein
MTTSAFERLAVDMVGRNEESRKVGNNTYKRKVGDSIAIRLHDTDILVVSPTNISEGLPFERILLNTGGYRTVTTKSRMNEWLKTLKIPLNVWSEKGIWFVSNSDTGTKDVFTGRWMKYDEYGLLLDFDGNNGTPIDAKVAIQQRNAMARKVKAYAALCADNLPLELPNLGDCLFCQVNRDSKGEFGGTDHLLSHMEEGYVVASLVYRAMRDANATDMMLAGAFNPDSSGWLLEVAQRDVKRAVYRFMMKQLGFSV